MKAIACALVALALSGCHGGRSVSDWQAEIPDCPSGGFSHWEVYPGSPADNEQAREAFAADGWTNITLDRKDNSANELEADCPSANEGGAR